MALLPDDRPNRSHFPHREAMTLRWQDNDVYGHMNNAVYYELFDTAVNRWLVMHAGLPVPEGPVVGLVAESGCRYFASVGFPEPVEIGLACLRVGRTSVTYRLALFGPEDEAAALCHYVHVYVDRESRRPVPLPQALRQAVEAVRLGRAA